MEGGRTGQGRAEKIGMTYPPQVRPSGQLVLPRWWWAGQRKGGRGRREGEMRAGVRGKEKGGQVQEARRREGRGKRQGEGRAGEGGRVQQRERGLEGGQKTQGGEGGGRE